MSSKSKIYGRKGGSDDQDVDLLLRAVEDDVLLKLSTNSHTIRGSSSSLDPDLERRFEALRSFRPTTTTTTKKESPPPPTSESTTTEKTSPPPPPSESTADDLLARFAALKTTLPSSSSAASCYKPNNGDDQSNRGTIGSGEEVDEEDEVQKVIQWAMDAARLDPSTPTGTDDDDDDSIDDDDGEDYHQNKEEDESNKRQTKN